MNGWNNILHQKFNDNYVIDVVTVNQPPMMDTKAPEGLTYVYAAILPPGRHTFLIYDPVHKRTFCKDIVVRLNTLDMFPEFPTWDKKNAQKPK